MKNRKNRAILWITAFSLLWLFAAGFRAKQAEQRNAAFVEAAQDGDADRVSLLLEQGADPNFGVCTDEVTTNALLNRLPAFMWRFVPWDILPKTCEARSPLLSMAAGVNQPNTPLVVERLLQHGAKMNAETTWVSDGVVSHADTALGAAVDSMDEATVRVLLRYGANPNQNGLDGNMPLFIALEHGSLPLVRLLVAHGAKNLPDSSGTSAVQRAAHSDNVPILEHLLNHGFPLQGCDREGRTALTYAKENSSERAAAFLLARGAKPQHWQKGSGAASNVKAKKNLRPLNAAEFANALLVVYQSF